MALTHDFEYRRPESVKKAVKLLARHRARAVVLAGGTDLIGLLRKDVVQPGWVVDIKDIPELQGLAIKDGALRMGALTTFGDLLESALVREHFPVLTEMASQVASCGIRHRATVAGNICSAVPCCDAGPVLLAYDAAVRVSGVEGKREIPMARWFAGPRRTSLRETEIVTRIDLPIPSGKHAGCFIKLKRGRGADLAQASVTVLQTQGYRYRVAFGSVAPQPVRGAAVEEQLAGRRLSKELIVAVGHEALGCIAPITDVRSTREYRALMVETMLARALSATAARFGGRGPAYGANLW